MRYIIPVALFGATAVMALSVEEFIDSALPECLRSCVVDGLEAISGCDLSDTDCFCKSGGVETDTFSSILSDMMDCAMNASCEMSDLEGSTTDPGALYEQAAAICSGYISSSSYDSSSSSDDSDDSSTNSSSNSSSHDSDDSEDSSSNSSSDDSNHSEDSSNNSSSNSPGDSSDDTADESTPAQNTGDEGDGAMILSGSTAILAAGAMMALAAF
ncbi:hypothetical protein BJX63DRAFT_378025 [Aspergillus granulosus]|uniref:CFEM domain-containing protein n=1 Tax=Aspergillus granulosus TaxID=176169 RepID=A0ABR4I2W6_9EURO